MNIEEGRDGTANSRRGPFFLSPCREAVFPASGTMVITASFSHSSFI
uniref:Uncharacterized protein n=1 Tax=Anguilla anguilla TaxID=7936 RepID=A0A0E9U151_ANGAN